MKLKTITVTGIDDRTDIKVLQNIQRQFPIVEFGVLISDDWEENGNRFMKPEKILNLRGKNLRLSAHLCGDVAIRNVEGREFGPRWMSIRQFDNLFDRCQLNISKAKQDLDIDLSDWPSHIELIIQAKSTKDKDLKVYYSILAESVEYIEPTVLIDPSGGKGLQGKMDILPSVHKVGYAGGINAGNIREKIMELESDYRVSDYWLDMESGVRTDNWFDVDKVMEVLDEYLKAKAEIETFTNK